MRESGIMLRRVIFGSVRVIGVNVAIYNTYIPHMTTSLVPRSLGTSPGTRLSFFQYEALRPCGIMAEEEVHLRSRSACFVEENDTGRSSGQFVDSDMVEVVCLWRYHLNIFLGA